MTEDNSLINSHTFMDFDTICTTFGFYFKVVYLSFLTKTALQEAFILSFH